MKFLLAMAYWQTKELKCNGVSITSATKAILAKNKASKIQRIAAQERTDENH